MSETGGGELGPSAPVGPGSNEIARLSAGLAIAAVDAVLSGEVDNTYSLSRPPGHHCMADSAMGFCFLANIVIAIEAAKAHRGLGNVAVIDWDVQTATVRNQSLRHQDSCFPVGYSGEADRARSAEFRANINIPLPPDCGHEAYLYALE